VGRLKVVSLFCGCGGGDLGVLGGFTYLNHRYARLRYETVLAVDKDPRAVATYNANFMHKMVASGVEEIVPSDINGSVDVILGGFPCQSFSTVNPTKDPLDERGQLYRYMAKFLREKQPKAFVAENVKGMLVLRNGAIFRRIVDEFSEAGYRVSHSLMNAADYGVPQRRQRVFIVGVRKDIERAFAFPEPTHAESPAQDRKKWVGIGQVVDSLVPEDPKYYFSQRAVVGMKNAKNNMKRGLWQELDRPCLTVTAHLAKVSINSRDPILLVDPDTELYRRFTPREAARIQSFPDSFVFVGSESDAYRQIGQAIPPVLMWHLAKSLYEQVLS